MLKVATWLWLTYTVEVPIASCHSRSSPATRAAATLGAVKLSPRLVEWAAVTPGASVRLVKARLGILEFRGSEALTAISPSPPPGATPRFSGLLTLLAQPPWTKEKIPQLSGWPSYLKGKVLSPLGPPSIDASQRHRSSPPGTPRMDST